MWVLGAILAVSLGVNLILLSGLDRRVAAKHSRLCRRIIRELRTEINERIAERQDLQVKYDRLRGLWRSAGRRIGAEQPGVRN